jgi:hypothetical protein
MCFSDANMTDIIAQQTNVKENADILKLVAVQWRKLNAHDRAFWDEEARNDKVRYVEIVVMVGNTYTENICKRLIP